MRQFAVLTMMLMIGCAAGAQTFSQPTCPPGLVCDGKTGKPIPLQCPKYQHEQYTAPHCANTCDSYGTCTAQCLSVAASDTCVDDMHTVTEREWQDLIARLKVVEKAGLQSTGIAEECLHNLGVCADRMEQARKIVQKITDESKHKP